METPKIRIGKDFTILWRIYKRKNGEKTPYMLEAGKENYILRLWTPYGKQEITRFDIEENEIRFDFLGKDQKHLGNYSLELIERKNAIGMVTVDTVGFTLVGVSRYETDGDNSDIIIQDVQLDSELGLAPMVSLTIDTELSETSHNAVANYVITEALKNKVDKSELETLYPEEVFVFPEELLDGARRVEHEGDDLYLKYVNYGISKEQVESYYGCPYSEVYDKVSKAKMLSCTYGSSSLMPTTAADGTESFFAAFTTSAGTQSVEYHFGLFKEEKDGAVFVLNQLLPRLQQSTVFEELEKKAEVHIIMNIDGLEDILFEGNDDMQMRDADVDAILSGKLITADSPMNGYILADEVYYDEPHANPRMGFIVFHYSEKEVKVVFDLTNKVYLGSQSYIKTIAQKDYVDGKLTELSEKKVEKGSLATINGQNIENGGNIVIEGGSAITPDWAAEQHEEGYIKNKRFGIQSLIPYDLLLPYSELRKVDLEGLDSGYQAYEYPLDEYVYGAFENRDDNPDAEDLFNIANQGEGRVVRLTNFRSNEEYYYYELSEKDFNQRIGNKYATMLIALRNSEHYLAVINDRCYILANIVGTFNPNPSYYLQVYEAIRLPETYISENIARVADVNDTVYEELIPIWENVDRIDEEISNLSKEIENLPSGDSSVFEAIYNTTTYDEIVEAYLANKHCVCRYGNMFLSLVELNYQGRDKASFSALVGDSQFVVYCYANNTWGSSFYKVEKVSNKVTSISQLSTDMQYPSAKAVYDALQQSGGGASSDKQGVVSQTLNYNSADNTYSVSNVVRGSIPSLFIDLVTEAGASFNAESGYFSLNGIDNIAYDEMRQIYNCRTGYGVNSLLAVYDNAYTARTNFAAFRGFALSYSNHQPTTIYTKYLCYKNASITKFVIHNESASLCVRADCVNNFDAFGTGGAPLAKSRLEEIIGIIDVTNLTGSNNFFYNGAWHPWLTTFQLKSLKASIDLSGMPRLSEATILYMINNEKAASAITIKLHADAKAMADASEAIQAALTSHPNVTLAK